MVASKPESIRFELQNLTIHFIILKIANIVSQFHGLKLLSGCLENQSGNRINEEYLVLLLTFMGACVCVCVCVCVRCVFACVKQMRTI